MDQLVTQPRKQRIKQNRRSILKKRMIAALGALLLTSVLVMTVYWEEGALKALALTEKYQVQEGDTLYSISKRFDTSVAEVKKVNKLTSDKILTGEKLIIPIPASEYRHVVTKGETVYSISKLYQVDMVDIVKMNNLMNHHIITGQKLRLPQKNVLDYKPNPTHEAAMGISEFYIVVTGDTLWSIAKRFDVPFSTLKKENGLTNDEVYVTQKLYIPGKKQFTAAEVVGAADNNTVEFMVDGNPVPLKVGHGTTETFQQKAGQKLYITYQNGALISSY